MAGIRTLVLLLAASALPTQFSIAEISSVDAAADKIYVSEFEQFTLTVNNFLAWCSITENSASYKPSAAFNDHTVVNLFAEPVTGFIWGHWEGTDADAGNGDPNKQAIVTMTSDRAVLACCPFPDNTGC